MSATVHYIPTQKLTRGTPACSALWSTTCYALGGIRGGRQDCGMPLQLLAGHIRDLCGRNAKEFARTCDETLRIVLETAYITAYEPQRRRRISASDLRDHLLARADELCELSSTLEDAQPANLTLETFCGNMVQLLQNLQRKVLAG